MYDDLIRILRDEIRRRDVRIRRQREHITDLQLLAGVLGVALVIVTTVIVM